MMEPERTRRSARGWTIIALRWIAALAVLGVLLHFLPLATVRSAIARVPPQYFLAALLGYLLAHALGVLKWRMVVNAAGAQLDFATSLQCYGGGLFGTLFLPSIVGGDVIRLAVGLRRSPRPAAVLAGNVVDRFLDVAAQAGLVALGPRAVAGLVAGVAAIDRHAHIARSHRNWRRADSRRIFPPRHISSRTLLPISPPSRAFAPRSAQRLARARTSSSPDGSPARPFNPRFSSSPRGSQPRAACNSRCASGCSPGRWQNSPLLLPLTQGGIGVREAALVALLAPFGAAGTLVLAAGLVWEGIDRHRRNHRGPRRIRRQPPQPEATIENATRHARQ